MTDKRKAKRPAPPPPERIPDTPENVAVSSCEARLGTTSPYGIKRRLGRLSHRASCVSPTTPPTLVPATVSRPQHSSARAYCKQKGNHALLLARVCIGTVARTLSACYRRAPYVSCAAATRTPTICLLRRPYTHHRTGADTNAASAHSNPHGNRHSHTNAHRYAYSHTHHNSDTHAYTYTVSLSGPYSLERRRDTRVCPRQPTSRRPKVGER